MILVVAGKVCAKQRGRKLPVDHRGYPTGVSNVVGLIGLLVFIAAIVSLAAGVTWVVVRISPTPKSKS